MRSPVIGEMRNSSGAGARDGLAAAVETRRQGVNVALYVSMEVSHEPERIDWREMEFTVTSRMAMISCQLKFSNNET